MKSLFSRFFKKKPQYKSVTAPAEISDLAVELAHSLVNQILIHKPGFKSVTLQFNYQKHHVYFNWGDESILVLPSILFDDVNHRVTLIYFNTEALLETLFPEVYMDTTFSVEINPVSFKIYDHFGTYLLEIPIENSRLHFGADFIQALSTISRQVRQRQDTLEAKLSPLEKEGVVWSRQRGRVIFAEKVSFKAIPIGSYSPEYESWCWVWANRSYTDEESRSIADLQYCSPLSFLRVGGFQTTSDFSFVIAYLAADLLGKYPIYRFVYEDGLELFLAVDVESEELF